MLAVLRQQDGTATAAPLAPECGLAELDRLVSRTCLAGVQVTLTRLGIPRDLPAGMDVSAFRIIQESLTNVVRHAGGGARCAVTVAFERDALGIEVSDDGGQDERHSPAPPVPVLHRLGSRPHRHARARPPVRWHPQRGPAARRWLPGLGAAANARAGRRAGPRGCARARA